MADEPLALAWVENSEGTLRGFHQVCADWLDLQPRVEGRAPYHTEICRGCGRFLLTEPPEHNGPKPDIDPKDLLC